MPTAEKNRFILNVIHRPEMVPEYAEKVTGQGKEEDISRKALLTESLDIFKAQQDIAHKNGIRTTIQMSYASLFNAEAVALAKEHHEQYGDEIGLTLLGLPCKEFRDKYKTKDFCIWMFSMEDKKAIVTDVFEKFHEQFGFYPASTGSYYTACYGTTEYPEDMTPVRLRLEKEGGVREIQYAYRCREDEEPGAAAAAVLPPVCTKMTFTGEGAAGYYKEGYAFSPMFALGQKRTLKLGEEAVTWLRLERAD